MSKSFFLESGQVEVVGISGKVGSGKTFLSSQLINTGFVPIALANHFKVDAVVKNGAPLEEVFGSNKSPEVRKLLQELGTEQGRNVHGDDIWIRIAEAWMFALYQNGVSHFVVPDVRFPNEVQWIQNLGGAVFRVVGRGGAFGDAANHISETALDDYNSFDAYIDNSPLNARYAVLELKNKLQAFREANDF